MSHFVVRRCLLLSFLALLFFVCVGESQAQWKMLKMFPNQQVRTVYFLDQIGSPNVGFVGTFSGGVYKTTDAGVSWTQCTVTNNQSSGEQIAQFTFKDAQTGWMAARTPQWANLPSLYWTTNGGSTWTAYADRIGVGVSVMYHQPTHKVYFNSWDEDCLVSSDDGQTWSVYAPMFLNGLTSTGSTGLFSSVWNDEWYHYSTDAGSSWPSSSQLTFMDSVEAWQPVGIPGTNTYYTVAEKRNTVYRSTNGGLSFSMVTYLGASVFPTGMIAGWDKELYIQTSDGFYLSTNDGVNWKYICGPGNTKDTRFHVRQTSKGTQLFAGDFNGALWYNDNVGVISAKVEIKPSPLSMLSDACHDADSIVKLKFTANCPVTLRQLSYTKRSGPGTFTLKPFQTLPYDVLDSTSFDVTYDPMFSSVDSGVIHIQYSIGSEIFDTIIQVAGESKTSFKLEMSYDQLRVRLQDVCRGADTTISFWNRSCDTLFLTNADIDDTTAFHLFNTQLPARILPAEELKLFIATDNDEGAYDALLKLHFHMVGANGRDVDTLVPLHLVVSKSLYPVVQQLNVILDDRCQEMDTVLKIKNQRCDSLIIESASIDDSTVFTLENLKLPARLGGGENLPVRFHVGTRTRGAFTTKLKFHYVNGSGGFDTIVTLTLNATKPLVAKASLNPPQLDFARVSLCASKKQDITFRNETCEPFKVTAIGWASAPGDYSIASATPTPYFVNPGETSTISILYAPSSNSKATSILKITFELEGKSRDTLIQITGQGTSTAAASSKDRALAFGSILLCESGELFTWLLNDGCDSIQIDDLRLTSGSEFSILEPTKGRWIHKGDSVKIRVALLPRTSGAKSDSIEIYFQDANGAVTSVTLGLDGFIKAPQRSISLAPTEILPAGISGCKPLDTTIVITNSGICDELVIDGISGSAQMSFAHRPFPIKLASGESETFFVHITPPLSGTMSGVITITGPGYSSGPIPFNTTVSPSYILKTDVKPTDFAVKLCQPLAKDFKIWSEGCASLQIDDVKLVATNPSQTQFTLVSSQAPVTLNAITQTLASVADTMRFSVLFNPDGVGDEKATLVVNSSQANHSSSTLLTGASFGIPVTSRLGLEFPTMPKGGFSAGEVLKIPVTVLDPVDDSVGLKTLRFKLFFNDEQLTLVGIDPISGWSLKDTVRESPGVWTLLLERTQTGSIAAGDHMASLSFYVSLGDSTGSALKIEQPVANESDPNFERCSFSAFAIDESLRVAVQPACGDRVIQDFMYKRLVLDHLTVHPNPVTKREGTPHLDLSFRLAKEVPVKVVLLDGMGKELMVLSENVLPSGEQNLSLNLPGSAGGAYFLAVETEGYRAVKKVVIEH